MDNSIYKEVLSKANIIDVIQSYGITITKNKCLCPFHDDKHPSMSIEPKKQIFKCFSCGESGNAISFVYKYERQVNKNMTFTKQDALKKVAEICNIRDIHFNNLDLSEEKKTEHQEIFEVNEDAQKVFQYALYTEEGKKALEYLHSRNIDDEIIKKMGIGYAFDKDIFINQDNIADYIDAGLVYADKDYKQDVFKSRITFPIYNDRDQIVGFGGRITDDKKSNIKYLNTKETKVFSKSGVLYNFNNAIKYIRSKENQFKIPQLYLVEGYMDVVGCEKLGIHNAIASMGTAFSKEQIELIRSSQCKINLMLDTDLAGRNAILENVDLLEKAGIDYDVIDLSSEFTEKDIGEIAEHHDEAQHERILQKIDNAKVSGFIFKIREYLRRNNIDYLNEQQIKEIVQYFHVNELNESDIESFIKEIEEKSMIPSKQIEQIIYPNSQFKFLKEKIFQEYIRNLLENEISHRENLVLTKYYDLYKDSILETVLKIIEKNSSKVINLEKGIVHISTVFNAYLRLDSFYDEFERLNTFKFPNIFEKVYVISDDARNIELKNAERNNIILMLENRFQEKMDTELQSIKEFYIINSIDDLFKIIPTGLIDPFTFNRIQHSMFDGEIATFDFNHCFDEEELKRGVLDMFDQTYKDEQGKLKKIMLIPNLDHSIKYTLTKNRNIDLEDKDIDNNDLIEKETLNEISKEFKKVDPVSGKVEIGCTIDEVLFRYNSFHRKDYMFIRVPNSKMKYYIRASRKDLVELNNGKTLFLKMDEKQVFEIYDANNISLNKTLTTPELLKYFEKKEKKLEKSGRYFNVFSSLIHQETKDGFFFYSPKSKDTVFYVSKSMAMWRNEEKKSLQVFMNSDSISKYKLDKSTEEYTFDSKIEPNEMSNYFHIIQSSQKDQIPKKVLVTFFKNDVDIYTKNSKDYAHIRCLFQNKIVQLKISTDYLVKTTNDKYIFQLDSKWKYTLEDSSHRKQTVTAYELSQEISDSLSKNNDLIQKEV